RADPLRRSRRGMARTRKKDAKGEKASGGSKAKGVSNFEAEDSNAGDGQEDLPKGEAGRGEKKGTNEGRLGEPEQKRRGRILNRERINKTIEGIYFICASCRKVCHNVDDGLVEDPNNLNNLCTTCATAKEPRGGKGGGKAAA